MISTTAYVSTLAPTVDRAQVEQLVEKSRRSNARKGVTGLLVLRGNRVMQLLEGDHATVLDLFGRISDDPRHHGVVTVWRSVTETRRFPEWTMGFDDLGEPADGSATDGLWLEPSLPPLPEGDGEIPERNSQSDYVSRRQVVLRRALASGDRLTTTLAIILNGHRPEDVVDEDAAVHLRCAECRSFGGPDAQHYPCSTARNAIWALEGTFG